MDYQLLENGAAADVVKHLRQQPALTPLAPLHALINAFSRIADLEPRIDRLELRSLGNQKDDAASLDL